MASIDLDINCIDYITDDLDEIADVLEEQKMMNLATAIRSKVAVIWETVGGIKAEWDKRTTTEGNAWCAGWVAGWNAQASMKKAVRCYECKHMAEAMTGGNVCERWSEEHATAPDMYCAWGERE